MLIGWACLDVYLFGFVLMLIGWACCFMLIGWVCLDADWLGLS